MSELCLDKLIWKKITEWDWDLEFFSAGIYIRCKLTKNSVHESKEEIFAMIFPSFRYGIAYEIYGISGELAGTYLDFFPDECRKGSESGFVKKEWITKNWNTKFKNSFPELQHILFSAGSRY